jgi:hypothetical protein
LRTNPWGYSLAESTINLLNGVLVIQID